MRAPGSVRNIEILDWTRQTGETSDGRESTSGLHVWPRFNIQGMTRWRRLRAPSAPFGYLHRVATTTRVRTFFTCSREGPNSSRYSLDNDGTSTGRPNNSGHHQVGCGTAPASPAVGRVGTLGPPFWYHSAGASPGVVSEADSTRCLPSALTSRTLPPPNR